MVGALVIARRALPAAAVCAVLGACSTPPLPPFGPSGSGGSSAAGAGGDRTTGGNGGKAAGGNGGGVIHGGTGGLGAGGRAGAGGNGAGGSVGPGTGGAGAGGRGVGGGAPGAVCGNGALERGESCDLGPLNGLFNGDGTGCSKTCVKEPVCRTGTTTSACQTVCGNGSVEPGESCDDGNSTNGDGCSSTCQTEPGFTCAAQTVSDTEPCQNGSTGQCLRLPVVYRDFKNESLPGGHPDFFYLGAAINPPVSITGVMGQTSPFSYGKRYCAPDSSGPAKQSDSTARCWDLAQANLDATGKPAFNASRNGGGANATLCDCQFTDFSHDTNGGHVPGYTLMANSPLAGLTYVSGVAGHPIYKGPAPVVASAASFAQWFTDNGPSTRVVGTLELAPTAGTSNQFRYTSAAHAVFGGFFPLDPAVNGFSLYAAAASTAGPGTVTMAPAPWNEPLLCSLFPYWYSSAAYGAGNHCRGDQYLFPPSVDGAQYPGGTWVPGIQAWYHDQWFTAEMRYPVVFSEPFELQFASAGDLFVFLNGRLVVDLGGTHQTLPARVQIATDGSASIVEGGSVDPTSGVINPCPGTDPYSKQVTNATCAGGTCDCRSRVISGAAMGLTMGRTYELAIFLAARHPTESQLQVTLRSAPTVRSVCTQN